MIEVAMMVATLATCASMKTRQRAKIAELRQVLLRAGYPSIDTQASARIKGRLSARATRPAATWLGGVIWRDLCDECR